MLIIPKIINDTIKHHLSEIENCPDDPKTFIQDYEKFNATELSSIYSKIYCLIVKKLRLPLTNGGQYRDYIILEYFKNHSLIDQNNSIHNKNIIYLIKDTYDFEKLKIEINDYNYFKLLKNTDINSIRYSDSMYYTLKQDKKLFEHYENYIHYYELNISHPNDIKIYNDMKLELDRYNDRLDLLIHNEDYNFNKNKIINDTKTLTESIFAFIDCTKQNPFRFTPSLFEYKFTQLIESEDYKFVKYNLTEDFRKDEKLSYIVTDIENQIFRLFKTYIYRGIRANIGVTQMREEFKIHYLRANEFLKNSENDAETEEYINDSYDKMFDSVYKSCQGKIDNAKSHSIGADLSIKLNNSFRINFERLFPRCGSTTRALYQTLCRMAESNGDSIIQYTSFKALALKCSTKIGHDTIKSLLHKLHDGKLINYIWKTINGREFIESIQILDNSEFVTLQKTVDTKFFKSDLASIPSIGKRGNELFWILNDYENGLTKKEIFRMFPGVSTTTPITKKLNELLKLGFVSLEGKIYKTDFNNFLLKLDDAKQNITRTVTVKSKVVSFKNGIQRLKYKNNRDTIKNYDREKLKKTIELGNIVRDNLVSDEEKENFSMRQFIRENLLPEEFDLVSKIKKTYNIASSHYVVRQFQKYQEESAHYRDLKKKEEIKTQLKEEKKLLKKVI